MRAAAESARDAFAVPAAQVIASEFTWGSGTCAATDPIGDITITVDGETWSGPIPTGAPRRVVRLSHEWPVRSAADTVLVSASGVCPCEEPQPFAGVGEISLSDRRFGAAIAVTCVQVGTGTRDGAHELMLKVIPSAAWISSLRLPAWSPADESPEGAREEGASEEIPLRPESDEPAVSEPIPEEVPR